jgi:hypothetical protein
LKTFGASGLSAIDTRGTESRFRKDGVANSFREDEGVPSSPWFLFRGVTKLSRKNRLLDEVGVRDPRAGVATSKVLECFSTLLGVAVMLIGTSAKAVLEL